MTTATRTITQSELASLPVPLTTGALPPGAGPELRPDLATFHFATLLKASGYDVGAEYDKAAAILGALDESLVATHFDNALLERIGDPLELSPDRAVALVRDITLNRLAAGLGGIDRALRRKLDASLTAALRQHSDRIIEGLRPQFNAAVADIAKANDMGITPTATTGSLIDNDGSVEQIAAYRKTGPAAATLNRITELRLKLCHIVGVGPTAHPITCLVDAPTLVDLENSEKTYNGTNETVLVDSGHISAAPFAHRTQKPRTGGPWLALIAGGYKIRLATGDEAQAVIDNAE